MYDLSRGTSLNSRILIVTVKPEVSRARCNRIHLQYNECALRRYPYSVDRKQFWKRVSDELYREIGWKRSPSLAGGAQGCAPVSWAWRLRPRRALRVRRKPTRRGSSSTQATRTRSPGHRLVAPRPSTRRRPRRRSLLGLEDEWWLGDEVMVDSDDSSLQITRIEDPKDLEDTRNASAMEAKSVMQPSASLLSPASERAAAHVYS